MLAVDQLVMLHISACSSTAAGLIATELQMTSFSPDGTDCNATPLLDSGYFVFWLGRNIPTGA